MRIFNNFMFYTLRFVDKKAVIWNDENDFHFERGTETNFRGWLIMDFCAYPDASIQILVHGESKINVYKLNLSLYL